MSTAQPMSTGERTSHYVGQSPGQELTARQRRRLRQKGRAEADRVRLAEHLDAVGTTPTDRGEDQ